jgi:hypothetical protein
MRMDEMGVISKVEAIETLTAIMACIDILCLATKGIEMDYGRAKEGMLSALDNIGWQAAAVMGYIEDNAKTLK